MRKRIIILGSIILAVIVLWSGAWLFLAGEIRKNVEALASADGVSEPRITCGTLSVGGYPFRFDLDCTDGEMVSGDVTAALAELRASVLVYRPTFLRLSAKGPITLKDAFTGSQSVIAWESLEGSARLEGWRIGRVSLVGKNASWTDAVFGDMLIASASDIETHFLDIAERHDAERGLAAVATYAKAENLVIPGAQINDGTVELETEISGLPDDVRLLGEPDALQRWQQAGGKVQIISLDATDGERFARAEGTLGLDDQARVEGQLNVTSRGVADLVFAAVPEGLRGTVVGPVGADGSTHQVINLRAGVMLVGIVPLLMLSPVY